MNAEMPSAGSQWLDVETGRRFVLLGKEQETVLLVSVDGAEACSIEPENLPRRFVPALPDRSDRERWASSE